MSLAEWFHIKDPSIVIHVGAHLCEERDIYLGSDVIWVEADPCTAEQAEVILEDYAHQGIVNALLREASGIETVLYRATNDGESSSMLMLASGHSEHWPHVKVHDLTMMTSSTLDNLCIEPDWITLDVQGAELKVLEGGERALASAKWLWTEVSLEPMYQGGVLLPELDDYLAERGWQRIALELTMADGRHGDALYEKVK